MTKVLLAAFYTPGIRAIEYLIQCGFSSKDIRLLTHEDERNQALLSFAAHLGIETKCFSVKSDEAYEWMKAFSPEVIFSLYFRDIMPQRILDIPKLGAVNLHGALLPEYRGTFTAAWSIINGEEYAGFTYHYMLAGVDTGRIILRKKVSIMPYDTAYSLFHRIIIEGMAEFGRVFHLVVEEHYSGEEQVGEAKYFPRTLPFNGYINTSWDQRQIDRFIRAMYYPPFKGALVKTANGEEYEVNSLNEYNHLISRGMIRS